MKRPIICHLSDYGPEYGGSFIGSLLSLARYCRQQMQIETLCLFPERARGRKWLQKFDDEEVLYDFIPESRAVISEVYSLLKCYNPLILHSQFDRYDLSTIFLKLLFFKNVKVVWHLHSMSQSTLLQLFKDSLKVKLIANFFGDKFISVGKEVYQDSVSRGFSKNKLILSYNGVDLERFTLNPERYHSARSSLGISKEQFVFLLLGWDPIRKGVDIFVRAAEEWSSKSRQKALFIIVGRKETREFLFSLPIASRLSESLRLIDPVDDFNFLLSGVDVLVSASRSEGFSYATLEAMAAGRFILCSDITDVRGTLGQSRGVWLFPSGDWKMLSELMEKVQNLPPAERESLGRANSQYVADHFSLESWTEQISAIYKELLH